MSDVDARPLCIEFRRIQAISSRGNLRIRLTEDGELFAYQESRDCPPGEHWSGPWPERPVCSLSGPGQRQLAAVLAEGGFFGLPRRIARPGRDGFRDEIDATLGAYTHSVCVERAPAPPAFARLRGALFALAGPPFSA